MAHAATASHPTTELLSLRSLSGASHLFLGTSSRATVQLVVLGVLSRLLEPAQFGLMAGATLVVSFASVVTQLGIGPALTQRATLETRHVRAGFTLCTILGVVLSCLLWASAPLFVVVFRTAEVVVVLQAISPTIAIQSVSTTAEALLQRDLRFRVLAILEVTSYAIGYGIVAIVLAWGGYGVWAIVCAHVTQTVIRSGGLLLCAPHAKSPLLDGRSVRDLVGVSSGFSLGYVGNFVAQRGDHLVVARYLGTGPLGLYERAYQLVMVPERLFSSVLARVLFPAMAKVQFTFPSIRKAYRRGVTLTALIALPTSVVVVTLANEIVLVLFGDQWVESATALQVLACGMLFRCDALLSDTLALAKGAAFGRAWRLWLYAGIMLAAAGAGIPWGLVGVALGTTVAFAANWLMTAQLSLSLLKLTWHDFAKSHLPGAAAGSVVFLLLYPLVGILRSLEVAPYVVLVSAGLLLSGIALFTILLRSERLLGSDGLWMYDLVRTQFRFRTPRLR